MAESKQDPIQKHVRAVLEQIGEDPDREGLERTPARVAKAYRFLTKGYAEDPVALLNGALFDVTYDEMVLVKDIGFYSLCEHHLLPFFGRVHVAYIPNGKVVGLSKIPRLVDMFARRLQVQERLTMQIAEIIEKVLAPRGVAVVAEAIHLCMMMRGRGAAERLRDHELAQGRVPERPEDPLRVHGADPAPQGELRVGKPALLGGRAASRLGTCVSRSVSPIALRRRPPSDQAPEPTPGGRVTRRFTPSGLRIVASRHDLAPWGTPRARSFTRRKRKRSWQIA